MANFTDYTQQYTGDFWWQFNSGFPIDDHNEFFALGYNATEFHDEDTGFDLPSTVDGAVRFPFVNIGHGVTVQQAILSIRVGGREGSQPVKGRIFGIKEANTGLFSSGPGSRTRTTAQKTGQYDPTGTGYWREDVTDIVNEILGVSGRVSGDAIGFFIENNGTDTGGTNMIVNANSSGVYSQLSIRLSAPGNFSPTPKSVSAPTFPEPDDYGIWVSKKGMGVIAALASGDLENFLFTTERDSFRVVEEGTSDDFGSFPSVLSSLVTHNLTYLPQFIAFIRKSGKSFKLNRLYYDATDPTGLFMQGFIASNTTQLLASATPSDAEIYYYVFIDSQDAP